MEVLHERREPFYKEPNMDDDSRGGGVVGGLEQNPIHQEESPVMDL